jgi:hypothetical protein
MLIDINFLTDYRPITIGYGYIGSVNIGNRSVNLPTPRHRAGLPMNHHRIVPVFFVGHKDNHHCSMLVMKKSPTPHHASHA